MTSGSALIGTVSRLFAAAELEENLADEYKVLKAMA